MAALREQWPEFLSALEAFKTEDPSMRLVYLKLDGRVVRDVRLAAGWREY